MHIYEKGSLALCLGLALAGPVFAEDWPTYRHDPARSGVSGETLAMPLAATWTYVPPAEPTPAWADPQTGLPEQPKLNFDDAFHVALAGDAVYFGSSVDHGVHALDAATGARRWTFFTEGPVRTAPTFSGGRVFAGSDDGSVYCLEAQSGRLAWSTRPIPGANRIVGAGRRMSLWPVRTDVLVDGGTAYCGAGLFPARGTALVALDANDGHALWKTSQVPKEAYVALAPQGYLLASASQVYVLNGRTSPLTYSRADGRLLGSMDKSFDVVGGKGVVSGGYGVLIDSLLYMGSQNILFGYKTNGAHAATLKDARQLVATKDRFYRLSGQAKTPQTVVAVDRAALDKGPIRGTIAKEAVTWIFTGAGLQSLIVAGPHVIVGGENEVIALDAATGKAVWRSKVDGLARGLAVANGRLLVSTDRGRIHCFSRGPASAPAPRPIQEPFAADAETPRIAALAAALVKDAGLERGYGLVMGKNAARLAYELARRTGLLVHAVEPDPVRAAAAREALLAAGAYGTRVLVDGLSGTNGLPYPPYFANLIVAEGPVVGPAPVTARALLKVLKPCGGVLYAGVSADAAWSRAGLVTTPPLAGGAWTKLVRGALPGAGDWTHQFADSGNSGSSDDERMRGRPEVLWYGEPGPDKMQDRHAKSEAPLSLDGRIYAQGLRYLANMPLLMCFDAYNGIPYWEREVPGAQRLYISSDSGNLAVSRAGLFVVTSNQCLQLDLATGATRTAYPTPAAPGRAPGNWGFVAVAGDWLIGSESSAYQFSSAIFAYDLKSGRLAWRHETSVVRNSTLAVRDGKVFFVEHRGQAKAPVILAPNVAAALAQAAKRRGEVAAPKAAAPPPYVRTVAALDLATGRELWAREADLTGCGSWGGSLSLIAKNDVLLLCGIYSAYGRAKGDEDGRRGLALSAKDGSTIWDKPIGNRVRPVVVKDKIVARPKAFSLQTGAPAMRPDKNGRMIPWAMQNIGACGQISASAGLLFFRDGNTAVTDVDTGSRVMSFTGMRPGCMINIVPAGGVAVQVESSSGCICAHALQGTIAFYPAGAE